MRTLVIHMDDITTEFLINIYNDKGWQVIRHDLFSKNELKQIIDSHDRIVMIGHGSPSGLFGHHGYIIDVELAPILRKKECVCIWCNADQFVKKHNLKGFYTGMFISEVQEAEWHDIYNYTQKSVDNSNDIFAKLVHDNIFTDGILDEIKEKYKVDNDPVVAYNNERLYYKN